MSRSSNIIPPDDDHSPNRSRASGFEAEIGAKIERGLAQLDRGEGISGERLRERLAADRAAWLRDRSGS